MSDDPIHHLSEYDLDRLAERLIERMDGIAERPMSDKTGLASYIGSGLATAVGVLEWQVKAQ